MYAKIMPFIAPPRDMETADTTGTKRKRDEYHISQSPKRMRRENEKLHEQTFEAGTSANGPVIIPTKTEGLQRALEKSKEEANAAIVHTQGRLLQEQERRNEIMDALKSVHERKSALQMDKYALCSLKRSEVCNASWSFQSMTSPALLL